MPHYFWSDFGRAVSLVAEQRARRTTAALSPMELTTSCPSASCVQDDVQGFPRHYPVNRGCYIGEGQGCIGTEG